MNDPNKAIDVNLSSLLSLKAELLRKQAEVSKAKITQTSANQYVGKKLVTDNYNSSSKKDKKDRLKAVEKGKDATVYEHEDGALLEKSQRVLQAKSKYYERMSRTGGKLNSDDNCLVLFNRKQQEEKRNPFALEPSCNSDISSSDEDNASDSEDDWVEYTDCLGRTRQCLRRDLAAAKKRDAELAASMPERLDQTKANWMLDTKGSPANTISDDEDDTPIGPIPTESIYSDGCSMVSKHDEQRANWERKEQENFDKPDVHYQDVFFDEARQHGVGYYAFSTDEEERRRQQHELEETRQQTISEQECRNAMRAQREKIIAERVRAAKNRQRARLGLPPLEKDDKALQPEKSEKEETKEERKERKRAEKLERRQEQAEKERERERQQHVRPWDKKKPGVPKSRTDGFDAADEPEWTYKPERLPMSQEQWNEKKRDERLPEFAPPTANIHPKRKNFSCAMMTPPPPPPVATESNYYSTVPPPSLPSLDAGDNFESFQSTKREHAFQRRNYEAANQQSDELEDKVYAERSGAAIPPPSNLDADFALPPNAKKAKTNIELERSIEAGLRFLRNNCDKGNMATKSSWTSKADY